MMTDAGPDPVGADQRHCQLLPARRAAALDHRQALGMRHDVLELAAEPQIDIGMVVDLCLQRGLQVGAVYHPIGCAGTKGRGFAERQSGNLAAGPRAHDADGVGGYRARAKPPL